MNMLKGRRSASLAALALLAAACGGEGESETTTTGPSGESGAEAVFEIEATDYDYPNMPDSVAVGTELTLANQSASEVHEAVVFRISDDEERPVEELLELPDEEVDEIIEFRGVLVALPEEEGFAPEGPVVLDDPGRYAVVCFLPIGHDAEQVAAAFAQEGEGPPELDGGPPHFTAGMVKEFTVEG